MTTSDLPKISVGSKALSNLEKAIRMEWLETNGLGGYASSTILGINTRKYHGLLVAALNPPTERHVLLTRLNEEINVNNKTYSLGANETRSGFQPEGHRYLTDFSLAPLPTFTYEVDEGVNIKKTVFMPYGRNATITVYEATNGSKTPAILDVSAFINSRHFHSVTDMDKIPIYLQKEMAHGVTVRPSTAPITLILSSSEGQYIAGRGEWVETFFRNDASRGESNLDNSFKVGSFIFKIDPGEVRRFSVIAVGESNEIRAQTVFSSIDANSESVAQLHRDELKRREGIIREFQKQHPTMKMEDWLKWLVQSADAFIVKRASVKSKSVIAGYHWFEDWGRDSLISLPGLTLVTGRFEDARRILLTFKQYCEKGLIPNRFPDNLGEKPVYNTVDATLWYFNAVLQYLKYTNDLDFIKGELQATLESIVENHVLGTMFNIHMGADGLIEHGPQLTWMDAAPYGVPITPREGKAVEIQALWYNALKTMELLALRSGQKEKASGYLSMAEKCRSNFEDEFWNPQENCLFDVVQSDGKKDATLRPNQVIALSLDFTMLSRDRAEKIVNVIQRRLWGEYGLRTLASDDPRYLGRYGGNWQERDNAYHNGTVWPWLLGPFTTAFLKINDYDATWRRYADENFLKPLFNDEVPKAGLGTISEIFDGDPPHEPNGCISQAWSVAEPIRAYIEDVLLHRPPHEGEVLGKQVALLT